MAKRVKRTPSLPNVTANVRDSLAQTSRVLYQDGVEQNYRLNLALPKDGTEPMEAPLSLQAVATGSLPSAALYEGAIIYDTTTNDVLFSDGTTWFALNGPAQSTRRTITSTDTVVAADFGNVIEITSGTFTLSFTAAATLGNGFWVTIVNSGTGNVTLDPATTELIDGLSTWVLYPGGAIEVFCTGTAFESVLLSGMRVQFDADGTFVKPGVGTFARIEAWGGGGSGGRGGAADGGGGGGGGAYVERELLLSAIGATETVDIGAGATAVTTDNTNGSTGSNTTFGSLVTAFGGGGGNGSAAQSGGGGGAGFGGTGGTATTASGADGGDPHFFWLAIGGGSIAAASGFGSTAAGVPGGGNTRGGGGGGVGGGAVDGAAGGTTTHGGGGGGGGSDTANGGAGGSSTWGGAGGGGGSGSGTGGAAGVSAFGGNGGAGATGNTVAGSGSQPGGGGGGSETGNSGAGGAGRVIVYIW